MTDVDIGEYEHMLDVCLLACLNIENQPAAFYYYYLIVIIAIKGFLSLQVFFFIYLQAWLFLTEPALHTISSGGCPVQP